ncbi:hypothetical protein [Parasitella parasitica]|uniref:CST complex subunit CTC1 n=1 Tax=Parasitella parasitica TaxID=35722 RepID=A0A0B7N9K3_9FUNG|nr:hypothetical protein [Parasitella parasitica]
MEPVSINDLKNYKTGTTSYIVEATLMGVLTIVTREDDEYPRGTILLLDLVTQDPVACLVDRMLPKALDTTVYIKKWNYINLNEGCDSCYVEFRLEDVYAAEDSTKCFLLDQLGTDHTILQQYLKRKMAYYNPGDLFSPVSKVNMAGVVYAISTLYANPNSPAMFFLQVIRNDNNTADATTKLKAVNLIFSGDNMIKYYHYFQIGSAFVFHNLDVKIINSGYRNSTCALSFNSRSTCQAIKLSQFETVYQQPITNITTDNQLTLTTVHKHKTYTGRITRVVDSMFGIYELDNAIIVSLFHLFSYSADMPFRIDTQLRLHHFHAVIINPEDGETSYLLQNVWQANKIEEGYMALASCIQSHVEILDFPNHCHNITETTNSFYMPHHTDIGSKIKEYTYTDIISRKSTFTQLLRQLEIYAALAAKFIDTNIVQDFSVFQRAYKTVRDQVFATTQTRPMQAGNLVNDFVMHDAVCLLVGKENFHVVIDSYPSLNKIQHKLQDNLKDYHLDLAGGNTMFEKENVLTQRAEYDQTAEYCVLGMLQVSKDGRLFLVDNESQVLFVLAAASGSKYRKAGQIYLIRRLQLYREGLSYVENETGELIRRKNLYITYFVCQDKDMLLLHGDYDNNVTFQMPAFAKTNNKELEKLSLHKMPPGFGNMPTQHQYMVVRVVARDPVNIPISKRAVQLVCRARVKTYEIEGLGCAAGSEGFIKATGTKECNLLLTSRKKTLPLHYDFQVGSYWVIYGLDKSGSQIANLPDNPILTFSIDLDKHTIYPVSFNSSSSDAIQLRPVYSEEVTMPNPLLAVHDVSQLTDVESLPAGLGGHTIPSNFSEDTVCVQGLIIIKRFSEGYPTSIRSSSCAEKLFNLKGIGTGKANRKLFVQLRQPDSLDTISIYMDVQNVHYPLGMVIGATVTFYNLIRKKKTSSSEDFYFLADSTTHVCVNNTMPSPSMISMNPAFVRTRLISSFLDPVLGRQDQTSRQIFKLYCYVNSIINLTLKWECRDCGSIVRKNDCYGMCEGASRIFTAQSFVQISDGTANANAAIDGERLVFRLLQLSLNQIDALKNLVLDYGQLSYGGWGVTQVTTMDDEEARSKHNTEKSQRNALYGFTLEELCRNAKRAGQFFLYAQVESKQNKKRQRDEEELEAKNLIQMLDLRKFKLSDNGRLLKTAEFSKLKLKAVDIVFTDPRLVAYEMLDLLNDAEKLPGSVSSLPVPSTFFNFE